MRRLFQSGWGVIVLVLIFLIIEFYTFIAIKTATQNTSRAVRVISYTLYIALSATFYISIFNISRLRDLPADTFVSKYFFAFFIGFFIAKLILVLFLFLGDIIRFFSWLFLLLFPKKEMTPSISTQGLPRSKFLAQSALVLGGLVLGTFLYGTKNKYRYQVRNVKLRFSQLPKPFKGLKIVHISDIHSGSFDNLEAVQNGVNLILQQKPDLILFTGDLVNDLNTEIVPYKSIFAQLSAPLGVFAVLGNHDYGDYHQWSSEVEKKENLNKLIQHIKDMKWELLMNDHVVFEKEGERLALIGIENWGAKGNFPKYGKMEQAVAGLDELKPALKILMSHDPSHWDAEVRVKYPDIDLTLSGHTHGMQFGVRLPWMQWSPVQFMYKQWAGLYQEGRQFLYVNPGFGFIGYKGRVGILPEITVLELND